MNNRKEISQDIFFDSPAKEGFNIDVKRILYRTLRYWYIVVISVLVAVVIAFLHNRYATRIYPVTASVIVKEADNISGAELLYNNPLLNVKRNYLNELYILKSYPLITGVIEDLNFDVAFYQVGNILTTELYGDFPIEAVPDRKNLSKKVSFVFTLLNEHRFRLETNSETEQPFIKEFNFGDTVVFDGYRGIFEIKRSTEIDYLINQSLIFSYTPSVVMADGYVRKVNADWAEEGAGVINLSLSGPTPKKERDFLAGLIAHYQFTDLETKNQTASRTVNFISEQLTGISDSLRYVELQLEGFKNKNVVTDLGGEALRLYEKIENLESQKTQLIISKNYYKYLIDYIQRDEELHQIILPTSVGIADPLLSSLIADMNQLQLDLKMSGKTGNPLVEKGTRRVNQMKKDIVESVRNQESTDNIKLDFLNKQIRELEGQLKYLPVAERTLISIQRNYGLLENLYIFLLQKKSEAAISKASNTSDIVVVNPPQSGPPISPRTQINYLIALLGGLAAPLLVFGLIELFDNQVQSKDDIEKITTIPFIGGVGHKNSDTNLAVFDQPKSALAESFRALRSNLNYFVGQKEKGIFLITSSISGEGKTFTSINLAAVLSMSGKRTLIVGADMRKPKIFGDFGLSNEKGLSNYLAGLAPLNDIIQKTSFDHLDFISGGPIPPNPSELLLTNKMTDLVNETSRLYDFVVIDSPPLAVVTDAFVLAPYADHVLFLVRQNYTPKEFLKSVEEYYATSKLKNISIVLNDIYKSGYGYGYGYGYRYGYGYYGDKNIKNGFGYYQ